MSRQCGWCSSTRRAQLEQRVLSGESIRSVAADSGFSESAAHRHFRNHLHPQILRELRSGEVQLHVSDFGARLVALLDESEAVRQHARLANDGRLLLQAAGQERETLSILLTRLGIDSEEVNDLLAEARQLVTALRLVLPAHPNALADLACELRVQGAVEMADSLDWLANRPATKEISA